MVLKADSILRKRGGSNKGFSLFFVIYIREINTPYYEKGSVNMFEIVIATIIYIALSINTKVNEVDNEDNR